MDCLLWCRRSVVSRINSNSLVRMVLIWFEPNYKDLSLSRTIFSHVYNTTFGFPTCPVKLFQGNSFLEESVSFGMRSTDWRQLRIFSQHPNVTGIELSAGFWYILHAFRKEARPVRCSLMHRYPLGFCLICLFLIGNRLQSFNPRSRWSSLSVRDYHLL